MTPFLFHATADKSNVYAKCCHENMQPAATERASIDTGPDHGADSVGDTTPSGGPAVGARGADDCIVKGIMPCRNNITHEDGIKSYHLPMPLPDMHHGLAPHVRPLR